VIEKEEADQMSEEFVMVYVTVDNEDGAVHLATALVLEKLVAYVNVKTGARSIYEADGIIQLVNEVVIVMFAARSNEERIIERVKELHSYAVPCINVLPIVAGNPDFMEWVSRQTL